jgi:hypothetical protein
MPKTYQYEGGKKAREKFESDMKALFKIPKDAVPAKKKARKKPRNYSAKPNEFFAA